MSCVRCEGAHVEGSQFDTLVKSFSTPGTRRTLVRLLAAVPITSGLLTVLHHEAVQAGKGKDGKNGKGPNGGHGGKGGKGGKGHKGRKGKRNDTGGCIACPSGQVLDPATCACTCALTYCCSCEFFGLLQFCRGDIRTAEACDQACNEAQGTGWSFDLTRDGRGFACKATGELGC